VGQAILFGEFPRSISGPVRTASRRIELAGKSERPQRAACFSVPAKGARVAIGKPSTLWPFAAAQ